MRYVTGLIKGDIKLILILPILLSLLACQEKTHPVVTQFEEIQSYQHNLDFAALEPYFDIQSNKFVSELFSAKSIDEYYELGQRYKLPYFFGEYYRWNYDFPQHTQFENLISFFNYLQFSFFDLKYQFTPLIQKSKSYNGKFYLPIGYLYDSTNKIRWLRFSKDADQAYKYDLLYSLEQNEIDIKGRFKFNKIETDSKNPESYRRLYESLPVTQRDMKSEKLILQELQKERVKNK